LYPQVLAAVQRPRNRVGQRAHAELDRRSRRDERRTVFRDGASGRGGDGMGRRDELLDQGRRLGGSLAYQHVSPGLRYWAKSRSAT
jgi:hypothetical protein